MSTDVIAAIAVALGAGWASGLNTYAAVRTSPMFSIASNASGAISNNSFFRCKFANWGFDNTQYMVFISCTGFAGNVWMETQLEAL